MIFHFLNRRARPPTPLATIAKENSEARNFLKIGAILPATYDLPCIAQNLRQAQSFAVCSSAPAAIKTLPATSRMHGIDLPTWSKPSISLLVAPGCLRSLAVIAQAIIGHNRVIVEDCAFARHYCGAMSRAGRLTLCPLNLMPNRAATLIECRSAASALFVTFPDRTLGTYKGTILLSGLGSEFYLSQADALIAELPFDHRLQFGPTAEIVAEPDDFVGALPCEEDRLCERTRRYFVSLCAQINCRPEAYLVWQALSSRSLKYQRRIIGNGRSILKSFMLCAKMRGHCTDGDACDDIIRAITFLNARS
ncbi:MAG: hypothetical protein HYV95_11650 [Opitutae bacterium]|nr:hypothetical protein [Opitutae bacterium]